LKRLEARLAEEAAERRRLEEQVMALSAQLAALGGDGDPTATEGEALDRGPEEKTAQLVVAGGAPKAAITDATSSAPTVAASAATEAPAAPAADAIAIDHGKSAMERALAAAGLDPETAEDIKRRADQLTMSEMYLRDQATREQWVDSPRFAEEMEAIAAQRTSVRDEIGDDLYDRYLFALGRPNRVRVDDVFMQSPAEESGLREGDMIVRYGDTRIFAPDELVAATHSGTLGEPVQLEVVRNGERFEVEIRRGPLGLRVAPTQDNPEAS
jgi:C-terminal processing protease CtpA/Prc